MPVNAIAEPKTSRLAASFDREGLLTCSSGQMFGNGNYRLSKPPFLYLDRITEISCAGGEFDHGRIRAELDIHAGLPFFSYYGDDDPIMPATLCVETLWQLLGFFLAWAGGKGKGRALSVQETKVMGGVLPGASVIEYLVELKKVKPARVMYGIADGWVKSDGIVVLQATNLKFGLFGGSGERRAVAQQVCSRWADD